MREFRRQFAGALLVILTVAAVVSAGINFQQQGQFRFPDDGVTWMERGRTRRGPARGRGSPRPRGRDQGRRRAAADQRHPGRRTPPMWRRVLVRIGAWSTAKYSLERAGRALQGHGGGRRGGAGAVALLPVPGGAGLPGDRPVRVLPAQATPRGRRHFYVLCLASFVLSTFHYTGKLNNFDKVMYWGNVAGGLVRPHASSCTSAWRFPESRRWLRGRLRRSPALYLPAAVLLAAFLGVASGTVRVAIPPLELRWLLDRSGCAFLAAAVPGGRGGRSPCGTGAPRTRSSGSN